MRTHCRQLLSVLVLLSLGLSSDCLMDFGFQLVSTEGGRPFIPCFTSGYDEIALWRIGGILYPITDLPIDDYKIELEGILIHQSKIGLEGNYSCYKRINDGYDIKLISSVYLKVLPDKQPQTHVKRSADTERETSTPGRHTRNHTLKLLATEEDTIYIPCLTGSDIDLLGIDSLLYSPTSLPRSHLYHYGGILVFGVAQTDSHFYTCYRRTSDGLDIEAMSVVELVVNTRPPMDNTCTEVENEEVIDAMTFDVQQSHFSHFKEHIEWRQACRRSDSSDILARLDVISTSDDDIIDYFSTRNNYFDLDTKLFNDTGIHVQLATTMNDTLCSELKYRFRPFNTTVNTDENCVPVGNESCRVLPNASNLNLIATWQKYPGADSFCDCAVLRDGFRDNCECFARNETTYNIQFRNISTTDGNVVNELCWINPSLETSGTHFLIYDDSSSSNSPWKYRKFYDSSKVYVSGPNPSTPKFSLTNGSELCVQSSENTTWNPLAYYGVKVYDITGDIDKHANLSVRGNCLDLTAFPDECAPLQVEAIAYTRCSASLNTGNYTSPGKGNICACLQQKVRTTLEVKLMTSTSVVATINASCSSNYPKISNLHLKANPVIPKADCPDQLLPLEISCALSSLQPQSQVNVNISGLCSATEYEVFILWSSPSSEKQCLLHNSFNFTTEATDNTPAILGGVIGGSTFMVATVSIVTVVVALAVHYVRTKKRCQQFSSGLDRDEYGSINGTNQSPELGE